MAYLRATLVLLAGSAPLLLTAGEAAACGGGFGAANPPPGAQELVVAAQRMAIAVSPFRTVLWSQIQYEGDPGDFAWVLPVGPGATIEVAEEGWFDALEGFTNTRIQGDACPAVAAAPSGCGFGGCGSAAEDGGARPGDLGEDDGVEVLSEGAVGPYESVILSSASGLAIHEWLLAKGYALPDDVIPILDAYSAEGMSFAALRLQAGAGTRQMSPVRVTTPGAAPVVPMRMMVAGAPASLPVTLYVISEGRYAPANYPKASLDAGKLVWDHQEGTSNYDELRAEALAEDGGRAFLTTFAMRAAFHVPVQDPRGDAVTFSAPLGQHATTLSALYFAMAAAGDGSGGESCAEVSDTLLTAGADVIAECDASECADGTHPAASLECDGYQDVAVALTGMRPDSVWVTRLEANLPRAALVEDLSLSGAASQDSVRSFLSAEATGCEEAAAVATLWSTPGAPPRRLGAVTAAALVLAALLRRRERARAAMPPARPEIA